MTVPEALLFVGIAAAFVVVDMWHERRARARRRDARRRNHATPWRY